MSFVCMFERYECYLIELILFIYLTNFFNEQFLSYDFLNELYYSMNYDRKKSLYLLKWELLQTQLLYSLGHRVNQIKWKIFEEVI